MRHDFIPLPYRRMASRKTVISVDSQIVNTGFIRQCAHIDTTSRIPALTGYAKRNRPEVHHVNTFWKSPAVHSGSIPALKHYENK